MEPIAAVWAALAGVAGPLWGTFLANAPYLIGFILPPFVQVLNRDVPEHGRSKYVVTGLVCIVVALLLNWKAIFETTDWQSIEMTLKTLGLILAESEAAYRLYFNNSALQQRLIVRMTAQAVPPETPAAAPAQ